MGSNNSSFSYNAWRRGRDTGASNERKMRPLWILAGVILRDVVQALVAISSQQLP